MSENVKPLPDRQSSTPTNTSDPLSLDTSLMQAAEARMRRALGLDGDASRSRPPERHEPQQRQVERFVPGHNGHKRRFVQDGEVPVTVVSGRRDGAEMTPHRGQAGNGGPTRLEAAETALAHEIAVRQQAERALVDAQALVHDLQTKLGHCEIARVEAVDHLRREQEASAALRTELRECEERLRATEANRAGRVRRDRVVHPMAQELAPPMADDMPSSAQDGEASLPQEDHEVVLRPKPGRRGRPPGKKLAGGKSKLVRWWLKDEAKAV